MRVEVKVAYGNVTFFFLHDLKHAQPSRGSEPDSKCINVCIFLICNTSVACLKSPKNLAAALL